MNESFVLINDHDPQPLRMQIERMREDEMGWEYIERRPEMFRILVTRVAHHPNRSGERQHSESDGDYRLM
ncbi:MAG: DUF2249 domain-containing protein [Pyrinomonadaceae bacterium MAG19_C2-C3]|nr:DUF2249 domain-containing protein [Pyrinomonadaceae bacterium MAG19_C2-C3]